MNELAISQDNGNPLLLDRQICFPLYAAANLLTRLYRFVLRELGLTYPQYLVMLLLWERDPYTVGALGSRLFLDSGTLTPLLRRMEQAGLLTRTRDPGDRRRVLIALTDKGRNLRLHAVNVPEAMSGSIRADDSNALRESVRVLVDLLAPYERRRPADAVPD